MAPHLSDTDLNLVYAVAQREGWTDLRTPPSSHPPRTLEETAVVGRFLAAAGRPARERSGRSRSMIATAVIVAGIFGTCWYLSPTRTLIGLVGGGIFCAISFRRTRKKARRPAVPALARRARADRMPLRGR